MSSPRKFSEKIALMQQKQVESDAAFNSIIYEVEVVKQRAEHSIPSRNGVDISTLKYEKPFQEPNGFRASENHPSLRVEQNNGSEQLLQLPENTSWRRIHSDSSLHHAMMPAVVENYHARLEYENNNQIGNYPSNEVKFEIGPYSTSPIQYPTDRLQVQYSMGPPQYQTSPHQYDLNNNNHNYIHEQVNPNYSMTSAPVMPMPQQPTVSSTTNHQNHAQLGLRYSGGNSSSNVLMLPPSQGPRGGGSLPDLRVDNHFQHTLNSFLTMPGTGSTNGAEHFFRTSSLQQNGHADRLSLSPQQSSSGIGPLKQSSTMRRRHSPIGDRKPVSPRRRNSPSPDVSSNHQTGYRVEPSSPQSQSSYSPQNSPHLLPSPTAANEMTPFSPPSSTMDNQHMQGYCALQNHFDRINLDATNPYPQQTSPPSSTHSGMNNGNPTNYYQQNDFFHPYMADLSSTYTQHQPTLPMNNQTSQKSPTIPNIILTDADSTKSDLTNELDNLTESMDLRFDSIDFLFPPSDLCGDSFSLEN